MQLASTSTPRSASNSATCSYDNGYRRYQRTPKMIISPGCWRPLKGLFGVIGMDFYPTSLSAHKFATEPAQQISVTISDPAQRAWGFEFTARMLADNTQVGDLNPSDSTTQVICSAGQLKGSACPASGNLQFIEQRIPRPDPEAGPSHSK